MKQIKFSKQTKDAIILAKSIINAYRQQLFDSEAKYMTLYRKYSKLKSKYSSKCHSRKSTNE